MRTRRLIILTVRGILLMGLSAHAHDTWLLPDRFEIAPNERVQIDLTSSMEFPAFETGPKRERVESAKARLAGRVFDITDISSGSQSLVFAVALPEAGIATIWVQLPPKSIELTPDQVREYLDEIDAPAGLRKQWEEMKPQRWREFYTKHQKTFVRVGPPAADRSWAEPVGGGLEIVPEQDPTNVRAGDEFAVRILKNGSPYSGFALNAVAAHEKKGETLRSDKDGRVVFRLTKNGPWLLRGTDLRKATRDDAEWESDFVTLTLEVRGVQP